MAATRKGTEVHAAIASETGNLIGSACRFKGEQRGTYRGMVMVSLPDVGLRYFQPEYVHRADECPAKRKAHA